MSTSDPQPPSSPRGDLLRVSAYDRAASMLVALLVLVGTAVLMLFVLWLTTRVFLVPEPPELVAFEEESEQLLPGEEPQIQEPGLEDLQDLAEPDVEDMLAAVTDAVSSVAASLDALDTVVTTRGQSGANRKAGGGSGIIPRWQRWEIRYVSTTLDAYAKQLEFFGIELAALGGGQPGVDYAYFQNGSLQQRRVTGEVKDDRLYFRWQGGNFLQQDLSLLRRAGISTTGRIVCQFFPPELENRLAALEQQALGNRTLKQVKKTVFAVQTAGRGYAFQVVDMQWRN